MIISRNGMNIQLTNDELFKAYQEQQALFDIQNIEDNLETYLPEILADRIELIKRDKELTSKAAVSLRKMLNNDVSYDYAVNQAITEMMLHSNERILKVMEIYKQNDIVMSELLRDCIDLTVSEKKYLLKWSGDDAYMQVLMDGTICDKYVWDYSKLLLESSKEGEYEFFYDVSQDELKEFAEKVLQMNETIVNMRLCLEKTSALEVYAWCELEDGSHQAFELLAEYELEQFTSLIEK